MSMLDSFFSKGFKASKCKTLLKLTIPRIKLLRNRREIQIKQMRRDIAKLLETGQEATARIRVEHIIREENMMAAHEILELFCELIAVRLPIIETQRECPIDLKEAISSLCFAAPRCADLPELLQVQIAFAGKYGREFVTGATELVPDCGVNRQLIELLSIRAPSAEKKLKILKQIAEEYNLDWDPAASETELFKSHEDLLNGPTQFASGTQLPLPEEKHEDISQPISAQAHEEKEKDDSDDDFDFDLPEVPKVLIRPGDNVASAPTVGAHPPTAPHHEINRDSLDHFRAIGKSPEVEEEEEEEEPKTEERSGPTKSENGGKQFVPFISPPSASFSTAQSDTSPPPPPPPQPAPAAVVSRPTSEVDGDLRGVIAAAQAAAESAERAAAVARSAASLAQVRINELTKKNSSDNPFHVESPPNHSVPTVEEKPHFDRSESLKVEEFDITLGVHESDQTRHNQPQRLPSMDDEYFSYPNLFRSQSANLGSPSQSFKDHDPRSPDER